MPTKEEVKKAYRNIKLLLKAVEEDKTIPEWNKRPLIDKILDRLLEMQKWLGDYLDEEDFEMQNIKLKDICETLLIILKSRDSRV